MISAKEAKELSNLIYNELMNRIHFEVQSTAKEGGSETFFHITKSELSSLDYIISRLKELDYNVTVKDHHTPGYPTTIHISWK